MITTVSINEENTVQIYTIPQKLFSSTYTAPIIRAIISAINVKDTRIEVPNKYSDKDSDTTSSILAIGNHPNDMGNMRRIRYRGEKWTAKAIITPKTKQPKIAAK